jgi:hypothetical protein
MNEDATGPPCAVGTERTVRANLAAEPPLTTADRF